MNSTIFRKVQIGKGAVIKNCVIMQNCKIEILGKFVDGDIEPVVEPKNKNESKFTLVYENGKGNVDYNLKFVKKNTSKRK